MSQNCRRDILARNLNRMGELLAAGAKGAEPYCVGLELERFLVDGDATVPYAGEDGVFRLLQELGGMHAENELVYIDGHLMGLSYAARTERGAVPVAVSLEPAAQIEVSVGPARCSEALHLAVQAFDRDVAAALSKMGSPAHLVALGYNPCVSAPDELELIPKDRYRAMDAYLSHCGRYARDMMRATASTQVSLDYRDEQDAVTLVRAATTLGPVLAFLFDNAPRFRGQDAPGMARSRIWREMDPDRCGTIPGTFDEGFSFAAYARWVSSVKPILMTDHEHVTSPTGDRTSADIMADRPLEDDELLHLMSMVFPNVRLKGFVELREMDSLPPRLACACASFCSDILYHRDDPALSALPLQTAGEKAVDAARRALEDDGWDARPYGIPVTELVETLCDVAEKHAKDDFDRASVELLRGIWDARRLPRNLTGRERTVLA